MSSTKTTKIVERLMLVSGVKTQAQLGGILNISQAAVTQAISKDKIPEAWIYKVAYQTGRRAEWLKSGQGPEFANLAAEEEAHYRRALSPALQGLINQWTELSESERSIVDSAMKLLLSADAETRDLVVKVVESVRTHRKFQRQQRASAPHKKSAGPA